MKKLFVACLFCLVAGPLLAKMVITSWQPMYKGIEHSTGTNTPDAQFPTLQVAHCMRIDLSDPDVQLFATPRASNYVAGVVETYSTTVSNFLQVYHLAVASDANFYSPSDPNTSVPSTLEGLEISNGTMVSSPDNARFATLMFTTNKQPVFAFNNRPPGASTAGIYTAVSGYYPVVSNGVNVGADAAINFPNDQSIHMNQPRTIFGVSRDRRYFYMATVDGRQPSYSEGALDTESASWIQLFGAWDAISMDGGGSTALYRADCGGNPLPVNHSSYIGASGGQRERIIGSHLGVFAKPLPGTFNDLTATPGTTTAIIRWTTPTEATTRVQYGPTPAYGSNTPLDPLPRIQHVAKLGGLNPRTTYYFQAFSVSGADTLQDGCSFTTTNDVTSSRVQLFDITGTWKYTSNNVDGTAWKTLAYDDSAWSGPGQGLLYIESNVAVTPRNTPLPEPLMRTYYFRKHFNFTGSKSDAFLSFSVYLDDGAVFYVNGVEVYRLRLPSTSIVNLTAATSRPCAGTVGANDATCADVFEVPSSALNSLVQGDNVLAVEVHNYGNPPDNDIVFGAAMWVSRSATLLPTLQMITEKNFATLFWNADAFTLQNSSDLSTSNSWSDFPGPVTIGPATVTNTPTTYYRLRR